MISSTFNFKNTLTNNQSNFIDGLIIQNYMYNMEIAGSERKIVQFRRFLDTPLTEDHKMRLKELITINREFIVTNTNLIKNNNVRIQDILDLAIPDNLIVGDCFEEVIFFFESEYIENLKDRYRLIGKVEVRSITGDESDEGSNIIKNDYEVIENTFYKIQYDPNKKRKDLFSNK